MFSSQMLALQKNAQNWPGWKDVYFPCSWQQKVEKDFQFVYATAFYFFFKDPCNKTPVGQIPGAGTDHMWPGSGRTFV